MLGKRAVEEVSTLNDEKMGVIPQVISGEAATAHANPWKLDRKRRRWQATKNQKNII